MKISYYPGCTLYTKAKNFNESTIYSMKALGVDLVELDTWTCCGASFSLVTDNLMNLVAPVRNLAYAGKEGNKLVTGCAFCYNTLKRANRFLSNDPEKRRKITDFIEEKYEGEVEVVHLLEVLANDVGFEKLEENVKRKLDGLRVAPYYGCYLLRPFEEIGLDNPEKPSILENLLQSLGCEVVDYPWKTECCGSYLSISSPDAATESSYRILNSAIENGAEVLVLSCPLCQYNLDDRQREIKEMHENFSGIPVLYFTQLLGIALEIDLDKCEFDRHFVDPKPILTLKGILSEEE